MLNLFENSILYKLLLYMCVIVLIGITNGKSLSRIYLTLPLGLFPYEDVSANDNSNNNWIFIFYPKDRCSHLISKLEM